MPLLLSLSLSPDLSTLVLPFSTPPFYCTVPISLPFSPPPFYSSLAVPSPAAFVLSSEDAPQSLSPCWPCQQVSPNQIWTAFLLLSLALVPSRKRISNLNIRHYSYLPFFAFATNLLLLLRSLPLFQKTFFNFLFSCCCVHRFSLTKYGARSSSPSSPTSSSSLRRCFLQWLCARLKLQPGSLWGKKITSSCAPDIVQVYYSTPHPTHPPHTPTHLTHPQTDGQTHLQALGLSSCPSHYNPLGFFGEDNDDQSHRNLCSDALHRNVEEVHSHDAGHT